jgi:hypothetical protein
MIFISTLLVPCSSFSADMITFPRLKQLREKSEDKNLPETTSNWLNVRQLLYIFNSVSIPTVLFLPFNFPLFFVSIPTVLFLPFNFPLFFVLCRKINQKDGTKISHLNGPKFERGVTPIFDRGQNCFLSLKIHINSTL